MAAARKVVHQYKTDAKKAGPEVEKLKAAKLEADRKLAEERQRQVAAQRKLTEMEFDRRSGKLVPQDLVHRQAAYGFTVLKQRLRGLPTSLPRLLGIPEEHRHAARMIIDGKIREMLEELSTSLAMPTQEWQREIEGS
jgi:hypothetical protein